MQQKKDEQRKKGAKDAQELHQFSSARNKKHCVPGELKHKASAMRNQADFSRWCC